MSINTLIEASLARDGGPREDALLSLKASSDIESRLSAAPLALTLLGHLAVISAGAQDFTLIPKDGSSDIQFELLKFPGSFRASLTQVGNKVHRALLTAHGNMGFLDVTMVQIPGQMMDIVQLLRFGSGEEIRDGLQLELESMRKASDMSKQKVKQVLDEFDLVIKTLEELVEGTQSARKQTEEDTQETQNNIIMAQKEEELFQKELNEVKEELSKAQKDVISAEKEFKQDMEKLGSWEELGKQIVGTLVETGAQMASTYMAAKTAPMTLAANLANGSNQEQSGHSGQPEGENVHSQGPSMQNQKATKTVASLMTLILENTHGLEKYFVDNKLDFVKMKDDKDLKLAFSGLKSYKEKVRAHLNEVTPKIGNEAETALETLSEVLNALESARESEKAPKDIHQKFKSAQNALLQVGPVLKAALGGTVFEAPSPGMVNQAKEKAGGSIAADQAKSLQVKLELREQQLRAVEAKAAELNKRKLEKNQELFRVIQNLSKFRRDEMTHKEIMKTITQGLKALYQLRQQWSLLFLYFKDIDNLMQAAVSPAVDKFLGMADKHGQRCIANGNTGGENYMSELVKNSLYQTVTNIVVTSRVVLYLSKTYLTLSNDHLMPMINGFGELMAISSDDKSSLRIQQTQLEQRSEKALLALKNIIEEGHKKFSSDLSNRKQAIKKVQSEQPFLLQVTHEEKQEAQNIAHSGFQKAQDNAGSNDDFCF